MSGSGAASSSHVLVIGELGVVVVNSGSSIVLCSEVVQLLCRCRRVICLYHYWSQLALMQNQTLMMSISQIMLTASLM